MSEFVLVAFPDEEKAYAGVRALNDLHAEGSVTVYETAVVRREPNGTLTVKERSDSAPVGTALGMLLGGLVGVLGGPAGFAVGTASGTLIGGTRDLIHLDISDEFLDETNTDLAPGKYGVIADIDEEWNVPLDSRMKAIGGTVIREPRDAFVDEIFQRRADAHQRAFTQWKKERGSEHAEFTEERLNSLIASERAHMQAQAEKAKKRLADRKAELNRKLEVLQAQAGKATPETRRRIEGRIKELRSEFDAREQTLKRAYEIASEALEPELHA